MVKKPSPTITIRVTESARIQPAGRRKNLTSRALGGTLTLTLFFGGLLPATDSIVAWGAGARLRPDRRYPNSKAHVAPWGIPNSTTEPSKAKATGKANVRGEVESRARSNSRR